MSDFLILQLFAESLWEMLEIYTKTLIHVLKTPSERNNGEKTCKSIIDAKLW